MRVAEVWRHPVKSFQGEALTSSYVGPAGLPGDRAFGVRDAVSGDVLSAKRVPELLLAAARWLDGTARVTLPDGSEWEAGDPRLDAALTEWLDRPVSLASADPSGEAFFDSRPVHLITTASIRSAAAGHPRGAWVPRRFRANVVVSTDAAGYPEDDWVDRDVRVGDAVVAVHKRTIRCAMTTLAQPGLPADPEILEATGRLSDKRLGVYAAVAAPGLVAVGDLVVPG